MSGSSDAISHSTSRRGNPIGIVGMVMVIVAAVLSPTGMCGLPLLLIVPLGFGGLIVCLISFGWKPRWPGAVGLLIGIVTSAWWFWFVCFRTASFGMTVSQHYIASMAAHKLAQEAELQRNDNGVPVQVFDYALIPTDLRTDPWGNRYRYLLCPTDRGYTFMSNGPDGIANTADDVDIFKIQDGRMFRLPPKKQ